MPLLSERYPVVYAVRVGQLRLARRLADGRARPAFAERQLAERLPAVVVAHESLLRRRLGTTDPAWQDAKVENLRIAIGPIDGLVLAPGETFSFWRRLGPPSASRGYREGLILRGGRPAAGVGGGLCQLANLIHWMALHSPLEVVERHHHSVDAFPDDRRALPFGTGASVFFNYVDLRLRNPTNQPFQIEAWITDDELRGRLRTTVSLPARYEVYEVGHRFERTAEGVVRCNEVWRRRIDRSTGRVLEDERLMQNRSRVAYDVDPSRVESAG